MRHAASGHARGHTRGVHAVRMRIVGEDDATPCSAALLASLSGCMQLHASLCVESRVRGLMGSDGGALSAQYLRRMRT